jgi:hypothetical protein
MDEPTIILLQRESEFPLEKHLKKITQTQLIEEHATLSFLCCSIYHSINNRFLKFEHSLGDGYFFTDIEQKVISDETASLVRSIIISLLNSDAQIILVYFR